jgi:hypothetical protein
MPTARAKSPAPGARAAAPSQPGAPESGGGIMLACMYTALFVILPTLVLWYKVRRTE